MHHCLNFVTEEEGTAAAVLIRGAVPIAEIDEISMHRFGVKSDHLTAYQRKNFLNGPGKLCRGLAITREQNALAVENDQLWVCDTLPEANLAPYTPVIHTGKRIGIDYAEEAVDFLWRFYEFQPQ
jgi:DNA-3-methyladenine glycosylase